MLGHEAAQPQQHARQLLLGRLQEAGCSSRAQQGCAELAQLGTPQSMVGGLLIAIAAVADHLALSILSRYLADGGQQGLELACYHPRRQPLHCKIQEIQAHAHRPVDTAAVASGDTDRAAALLRRLRLGGGRADEGLDLGAERGCSSPRQQV